MPETIEGLKERKAWLLKQVELTDRAIEKLREKQFQQARAPRPTPQDLPGLPPAPPKERKPNVHFERHEDFQAMRAKRLDQLGVEFVADEPNEPAFIAATMQRLRRECTTDEELLDLMNAYLASASPSRYTPPFPLRGLASEKWWRPLLEQIRASAPGAAH